MTYTIMINEVQRQRILTALQALDKIDPPKDVNLEDVDGTDSLLYLAIMFEDLPAQEAETPNALHGFSL